MKSLIRRFRQHFGATAKRVAVRSQRPWYWRLLLAGMLISLGYVLAYWQLIGGGLDADSMQGLRQQSRTLQANVVRMQRELQFERSAQTNLAKELRNLQDESMRLKEDVAFYKNILNDNSGAGELKFYSFRVSKSTQPNHYDYYILLAQSGRHNPSVQGQLHLKLSSAQGEKIALPLTEAGRVQPAIKINFKYYQRLEGSFAVPNAETAYTVEASFIETGASQPKISQKTDLPV